MKSLKTVSGLLKGLLGSLALMCCATARPALAQSITVDGTLSTAVSPSADGKTFTITAGDRAGTNLFHSFSEFSIPAGSSAVFNNPTDILNIISRVTADSASTIDGLIKANGSANLFLLNPSGIVFGPSAQLNIGGSFIGSTAESLHFEGGAAFVATESTARPLLTMNAPVGLQLGQASGNIRVTGAGHSLTRLPTGEMMVSSASNLSVKPGQTLALLGRGLSVEGGRVSTIAGRIELGSVDTGRVELALTSLENPFNYTQIDRFEDIQLSQGLVDAVSPGGGLIQLQGRNILLTDGGEIFIQNKAPVPSGGISINASETLRITGNDPTPAAGSGLTVESLLGPSGDITVSAKQLIFSGGNGIESRALLAQGGNVTINVPESVLLEASPSSPRDNTGIDTATYSPIYAPAQAGDLTINTRQLTIRNGSTATSISYDAGNSGNVNVNVGLDVDETYAINVIGNEPVSKVPSLLSAGTFGTGNAGNVVVNTGQLLLREGGRVDSSTANTGNAGSVSITATDSVVVNGKAPGSINPSLIISSANILDDVLKVRYNLPDTPTGNSGDLTITAPTLTITDGAQVTVRNDGTGSGGTLRAMTGAIDIRDGAGITASTQSGGGGNIDVRSSGPILLRAGSTLSAEAGGAGDGGNILIKTPFLIALDNSDIAADAFEGDGGNIGISAQSILGSTFRQEKTPESDITASSEFGVSGVVSIDNIETDPDSGTVALPENVTDPSQQIVAGCTKTQDNQFVASGRGGLPPNPVRQITVGHIWSDVRETAVSVAPSAGMVASSQGLIDAPASEPSLHEATAWTRNANGDIALTAAFTTGDRMAMASAHNCLENLVSQSS